MNNDPNPATPPTGWQYRPGDSVTPDTPAAITPAQQAPLQNIQTQEAAIAQAAPNNAGVAPEEPEAPVDTALLHELAESALLPDNAETTAAAIAPEDHIEWTASEYVAHQKTVKWYTVLMLSSVVAATVAYFLTKDIISAVSIVLIALVFALLASHPPRVLKYRLDTSGLTIDRKTYGYGQFRSFAIIDEGAFSSIMMVPLKRFMPMISLYFEPADEEKIIKVLSERLPLEQRNRDVIDTILHKIRF